MLIEFSVENFRSIHEHVTLSMIAAKIRSSDAQLDTDNLIRVSDKLSLLRSSVIYGANASGKSNIFKAINFMRQFIRNSARLQDEDTIPVEPFLFDSVAAASPSTFEAVFLLDGLQYRYGFAVTTTRVTKEWLFHTPTIREVPLFTRDEEGTEISDRFRQGRGLEELNLDNKLFLSVVAQFKKGGVAKRIRDWFLTSCRTLNTVEDKGYLPYTMQCIEQGTYREQIENIVRRLDLDITGLSVGEIPAPASVTRLQELLANEAASNDKDSLALLPDVSQNRVWRELRTHHAIRNSDGKFEEDKTFSAGEIESAGTQKLIALTGPLVDVLTHGWVLFIDEIDARLHPLITAAILQLFHSPETNPKNAQLICATHDTNLLDRHRLRRDQIYFVEKDRTAASHLYSLAEFKLLSAEGLGKIVRNDEHFEKNYIQGRYGAIPYLGDLRRVFIEEFRREEDKTESDTRRQQVSA